jgi:hypothetical protein
MKAVRSLLLMLVVVTLGGCWWGPGPGYDHGGYGHGGGYDHDGGQWRDR